MTALARSLVADKSDTLPIFAAILIGVAILFTSGFANSAALHDAAHDTRHATGFPCH